MSTTKAAVPTADEILIQAKILDPAIEYLIEETYTGTGFTLAYKYWAHAPKVAYAGASWEALLEDIRFALDAHSETKPKEEKS